jgi:hypothetical protein
MVALIYTWFVKEGRPFCLAREQGAAATSRGLVTSVPNSEARLTTVPQSYRYNNDCADQVEHNLATVKVRARHSGAWQTTRDHVGWRRKQSFDRQEQIIALVSLPCKQCPDPHLDKKRKEA